MLVPASRLFRVFRRRPLALLAAGTAAVLTLAACGGGTGAKAGGAADNTLIVGMTAADIPLLDTSLARGQGFEGVRFVANQLFDGLTKYDLKQGTDIPKVVPGLAESWTPNADLTSWTFKLRSGVKFHDGTPWNADAAVFNLQRYTDKSSPQFYPALNAAGSLSIVGIKGVSKVDDMTIQIDTKGPWAFLPDDLTIVFFGSPTAIQKEGNEGFGQNPVGTGPFKFVSMTRGQRLVMQKNPDYWAGAPKLDKLILRPIPDPTARIAALRSGEVNWAEVPLPDDVPNLQKEGFQVVTNAYAHVWPWAFNVTKKPLNDPRVRQALNYAIDRDSLVKNILKGTAEPALQYPSHADPAYREQNNVYTYDPEKAKKLLADAGYPNGFTMTLVFPTSGSGNMVPIPMNTALQADLAKVGVQVQLKPMEWAALRKDYYTGKIPDDADAVNASLAFAQEAFWGSAFGTGSNANPGHYSNPQVDGLLAQAKTVQDPAKRADIYAQVGQILNQDSPWLVVVNDRNPRALGKNVHGFVMPKSWFADLTTVSVGKS
jgi:peptide/nickel transport system substrate-binding protein